MSYTYIHSPTELYSWIKDEVIFNQIIKKSARNGGLKVRRIQEWLAFHGYNLGIDGYFGSVTETVLKRFQRANSLTATGQVNAETFNALVQPMLHVLKRPAQVTNVVTLNDAILLHAERHKAVHPIELGSEANSGMWVRLYMKGQEGYYQRWCAGFASFIIYQAAETLQQNTPLKRSVSVDILASHAKNNGQFRSESEAKIRKPPAGSLFILRASEGDWNHVGIVTEVHNSQFETIEGNANHQREVNGYEVCSVSRGYADTDFIVFDDRPVEVFNDDDFEVKRYFYENSREYVYGSFFRHWGGWVTARHVIAGMRNTSPPWAPGEIKYHVSVDGATIGCMLPEQAPPQPVEKETVTVIGYPAGSQIPAKRKGEIYFRRNVETNGKSWIVKITDPTEPVVPGMSGGVVLNAAGDPLGIIITTNSPADLDPHMEGKEHSLDIASLRDLWDVLQSQQNIA